MIKKVQIILVVFLASLTICSANEVSRTLVKDAVFVAIDTETTGLSPKKERIVEMGAVKFRGDGTVIESASWLIDPMKPIPWQATNVNRITDEMVVGAPAFAEVWPEFEKFCQGSILLAHNAKFDVGFLKHELKRAGLNSPGFSVVDTAKLFKTWFPNALNYSLEPLVDYVGAPKRTFHRAKDDALHISDLFHAGMLERPMITIQRLGADAGGCRIL